MSYDPTYAYELAVIIHDGLKRMYEGCEDIFYYITVMNENYPHPPLPEGAAPSILKGLYLLQDAGEHPLKVQLLGSGLSVAGLMQAGTVFVVVHAEVDYRSPARYGETLAIATVLSDTSAASFTFAHRITEKISGRFVVEGSARLAATDGNGKVKRLDKATLAALQSESKGMS